MGDRLTVNKGDIASCRDHMRKLQIMMRLKIAPPLPIGLADFHGDLGSLPMTPPGELTRRGVIDPIRVEPINNIIVTRQQNRAPFGAPPRLGNLPVHDTCELVNDDFLRLIAHDPGKIGPEFLTI